MLGRLATLAILSCLAASVGSAESISLQQNGSLIPETRVLPTTAKSALHRSALPGDLGRGFVRSGPQSPRPAASSAVGGAIGDPAAPLNHGMKLVYFGADGGPAMSSRKKSLLDSILDTLFQRKPHGNSRKAQ
jgi:hypothetical protein